MRGFAAAIAFFWVARAAFGAVDETLGDAQGLAEEAPVVAPSRVPSLETRGYLLGEGIGKITDRWADDFPAAEMRFSAKWKPAGGLRFLDALTDWTGTLAPKRDPESQLTVNQVFARAKMPDESSLAGMALIFGKERSRRSSALLYSASDFLYARDAMPGQRAFFGGRWQCKLGWSSGVHGVDFAALPWTEDRPNGLPDTSTDQAQGWLRAMTGFGTWDFGLQAGWLDDAWRVGASAQTYVWDVEKVYAEWGYSATDPTASQSFLVGSGYEGSERVTARAEFLYQGSGMSGDDYDRLQLIRSRFPAAGGGALATATPNLFLRRLYVIAQLGFPEIRDRFNVNVTAVRSLEDRGLFVSSRGEWLASGDWVLGGTWGFFGGDSASQYRLGPVRHVLSADLKWSF